MERTLEQLKYLTYDVRYIYDDEDETKAYEVSQNDKQLTIVGTLEEVVSFIEGHLTQAIGTTNANLLLAKAKFKKIEEKINE